MCTLVPLSARRGSGALNLLPSFHKREGGFDRTLFFRGGDLFEGGGGWGGIPMSTKKKLTPQCTLCLKMHFESNKSVFLLKEIQHTSKLLELI